MTTKQKTTHGTGIMNKMRDKMPYIIVFLIIAFVGLIVFEWGMNYVGLRGGDKSVFGKVNGEEITYQEYEKAVFDWLMEPVAVKLGYWVWQGDGSIPMLNYICWFLISLLLLAVFHFAKFNKQNKFAVNLLLTQLMFFLLLRTFLK